MDNTSLTYAEDSKLGALQISWHSELALLSFMIKCQTGHCNKAEDALSCHPCNRNLDSDGETGSGEVEVISHSSVCEVVDYCPDNSKIPDNLKIRHIS